ncbi:acyl carrier protein [Streptomyces sp. NPDC017941]|uniref:acyl carrier protein n=1 Tax=Streptomyces sp. NPDC017941 TaxID=3365018 RepID=UPI0037A4655F
MTQAAEDAAQAVLPEGAEAVLPEGAEPILPEEAESALPEELVALLTGRLDVRADAGELSGGTTFESLGLDSLSLMEFVVAAEEEYGIVLPADALDLRPSSTLGEAARAFAHAR